MMEALWEFERLKLFQFVRDHPDWSSTRLAEAVGESHRLRGAVRARPSVGAAAVLRFARVPGTWQRRGCPGTA